MARQISVSKSGIMADVLDEARRTFDDADTEGDALRRALIDWHRNRQANSKRASLSRLEDASAELIAASGRIEQTSAYIISCMGQMSARIAALEANMKDAMRENKVFIDSPFKVTNGESVKK